MCSDWASVPTRGSRLAGLESMRKTTVWGSRWGVRQEMRSKSAKKQATLKRDFLYVVYERCQVTRHGNEGDLRLSGLPPFRQKKSERMGHGNFAAE